MLPLSLIKNAVIVRMRTEHGIRSKGSKLTTCWKMIKKSASKQPFFPNPIEFDFSPYFLDLSMFLNVFKRKRVDVLILTKLNKQNEGATSTLFSFHLIFSN